MRVVHFARALAVACLALAAGSVHAHEIRPAYLEIRETAPDRFDVLWKQPRNGTLALRLEPYVSNGLLSPTPASEFAANSFVIREWRGLAVARDSFNGATIGVRGLEATITDALVHVSFLSGQDVQEILRPQSPSLTVRLTGTGKVAVPAYLRLGVEHILTGIDHLSFVLALVLIVGGRLRLVKTITAFTIAHSLTLGAAALGYVHVSAPVIESLVALSIVFVAVELVHTWRGQGSLTARRPWLIAFTFGLLHGFAFAGSLAEIGLPQANIPAALLLFNLGVELGQLAFVAAALAAIAVAQRVAPPRLAPLRWAAPYAIGVVATFWMFERVHTLVA